MTTKRISQFVKIVAAALAILTCALGFTVMLKNDHGSEITPPGTNTTEPGNTTDDTTPEDTSDTDLAPGTEYIPPEITNPPVDDDGYINYLAAGGELELPVVGASGYASIPMDIKAEADASSAKVGSLTSGEGFRIISESGAWWKIESQSATGWVTHKFCFINLPDVIPSAIYYDSNAIASQFVSSGKKIPGISGYKLYDAFAYNERLGRDEFIMPVLYSMAPKICAAQQAALENGNTLVIYETFRPRDIQQKVVNLLTMLAGIDEEVNSGITTSPWSMTWFISTGVSNHQKGYAFDVSLGKVLAHTTATTGQYKYTVITSYAEFDMPTPMHELSLASASMQYPVSSKSDTAWRDVPPADSMNEPALLLKKVCTGAGLSPLASEWWHFNDLSTAALVADSKNIGDYYINTVMSRPPEG